MVVCVCMCMVVCVGGHTCLSERVEISEQLAGVTLLVACGSWGSNSGFHTSVPSSLSAESSTQPLSMFASFT